MEGISLEKLLKRPPKKAKLYNHFQIEKPMEMFQIDLLFLPQDRGYLYALTLVDCASRYKAARPLKTKFSNEVIEKLIDIINNDKYLWKPEKINLDRGGEFDSKDMLAFCKKHKIKLVYNEPSNHLAFVESFNKELAKRLFISQQKKELETGKENGEWVANLEKSVRFLNNRYTKLIAMKPVDAVQLDVVLQPQNKFDYLDTVKSYPIGTKVLRMLNSDEYVNLADNKIKVERRRATDVFWYPSVYTVAELNQKSLASLVEHFIKDEFGNIYPHTYTYFQLQKL